MKYLTVTAALATLALSHLTVAHAETNTQRRSETVKFSDLDITSRAGATVLYQRLVTAAAHVCRDPGESHRPELQAQRSRCRDQAVGDAVVTIDTPAVTTIAAQHGLRVAQGAGSN